jgi:hypothetical protein
VIHGRKVFIASPSGGMAAEAENCGGWRGQAGAIA